jgi:hypothetical protein
MTVILYKINKFCCQSKALSIFWIEIAAVNRQAFQPHEAKSGPFKVVSADGGAIDQYLNFNQIEAYVENVKGVAAYTVQAFSLRMKNPKAQAKCFSWVCRVNPPGFWFGA